MIVLDASALIDVLMRTPRGQRVDPVLAKGGGLAAPDLIVVEVLSAIHRLVRAGVVDPGAASVAVGQLLATPLRRVDHALLGEAAWNLRDRVRITDAFYVACAQLIGAPLLTTDARLGRAALSDVTITVVS